MSFPDIEESDAELVRRFHEVQDAFYSGDCAASSLAGFLAKDIRWHVPGDNAIAGEYAGHEEVLAYFTRRRDLARGTFRLQVREIVAVGGLVVQVVGGSVDRSGTKRAWETVGILRVSRGSIEECWLVPLDQRLFDEIWSWSQEVS